MSHPTKQNDQNLDVNNETSPWTILQTWLELYQDFTNVLCGPGSHPGLHMALSSHVSQTFSYLRQPLTLACLPGSWHFRGMLDRYFAGFPHLMFVWCVLTIRMRLQNFVKKCHCAFSGHPLRRFLVPRCLISGDVSLDHLGLSKWIE